ncbi:MAG: hypothetical protein R3F56_21950 [Planctomycetota bacterium]
MRSPNPPSVDGWLRSQPRAPSWRRAPFFPPLPAAVPDLQSSASGGEDRSSSLHFVMTEPHTLTRLLPVCLLAGLLGAQGRTWIVDANGSGDFTDLTPALAAAADHDIIRVLPGLYNGGSTNKALAILGTPGARLQVPTGFGAFQPEAIEVTGLPAGETFVLKGIEAAPLGLAVILDGAFVRLVNCLGSVHIDRVQADMLQSFRGSIPAVAATNCAQVTISASVLRGAPAVFANASTVTLVDCDVQGQAAFEHPLSGTWMAAAAADVRNGRLLVGQSRLTGGNGAMRYLGAGTFDPSAAIVLSASEATLAATSICQIAAGGAFGAATSAVAGTGTVLRDGRVGLASYSGAPPVAPTLSDRTRALSSVLARGAAPGGTFAIDLFATTGELAEIYLSLPSTPLPLPWPDTGELWVDPTAMLVLGRVAVPPSETVQITFVVPNLPSFVALPIVVQAIAGTSAGVRTSTPATTVLD